MNLSTVVQAAFMAVFLLLAILHIFELAGESISVAGVGDLLIGLAAVTGAATAVLALNTWKKQRDSEVAKKLAAALYQYRVSLHRIRFPNLLSNEQTQSGTQHDFAMDLNTARLSRWRNSRLKLDEVQALLSEADLHWPTHASDAFNDVRNVENELFVAINRYGTLKVRERDDTDRNIAGHISDVNFSTASKDRDKEISRLEELLNDDFRDGMRKRIETSFERSTTFLRTKI